MKYMLYSADCLRLCSENIAKISGGSYKAVKFSDIIFPDTAKKEEEKSEKEVISDIRSRLSKLGGKG